jgi:hypothetical protein
MNHSKAILSQLISPDVFSESADILGITIKRDNATQFAYEPCGAKCKASQVGSNIIDNHPRLNSADNCILHVRFVSALPIPCFTRDAEAHPHSLRKPGLDLDPDLALHEPLYAIHNGRTPQNSPYANPFEDRVQTVEQGITPN